MVAAQARPPSRTSRLAAPVLGILGIAQKVRVVVVVVVVKVLVVVAQLLGRSCRSHAFI
jgi:hypothetical protein